MDQEAVREARLRLSREQGAAVKDWGGRLPVALIYPNSYYIGMSGLGFHLIYNLLNQNNYTLCERVFWHKRQPVSIESQRPLTDFAVVAFSISYELDCFNIIPMLKAGEIPLFSAGRDETHPLVIAGGPSVTANPAPLAPFFDCLCIGEAEAILPALLPVLSENTGERRADLLRMLAEIPGVYVPGLPPKIVARQWTRNLDESPAHTAVITKDTELGGMYLIEAERGCGWGCRFCLAGSAFRPVRFRSVERIVQEAEAGLKYRKRLGLVGASVPDHPRIEEIATRLSQMGAELAVSSLRIKPLPTVLLGELAEGGTRSIALAPEAGSERLRRVIKKGVNEDDILAAMEKVASEKIQQLKLYFMIGLPTETDDDIASMVDLALRCKAILDARQRGARMTLNISPFVPKAGTPFQWRGMAPLSVLESRLSILKNGLEKKGVKIKAESPVWSEVQAVLSRGDGGAGQALAKMESATLNGWRHAAQESGLDTAYFAHGDWDVNRRLPWGMIESGTDVERLRAELERALG